MESKFSSPIGGGNSQDYGQIEFSLDPLPEEKRKTYEVAKQSIFGMVGGFVGNTIISGLRKTGTIDWLAGTIKFDEKKVVEEQRKIMLDQLKDPHFIEFYEFISSILITKIEEKVYPKDIEKKTDNISLILVKHKQLFISLIKVVLARAFANLAKQMNANEKGTTDQQKPSSLTQMISFLCEKGGKDCSQELAKIEEKYRKAQTTYFKYKDQLFPGNQEFIYLYLQEYKSSKDNGRKKEIRSILAQEMVKSSDKKNIQVFFESLDLLNQKEIELTKVFAKMTDRILLHIFPKKLSDIKEIEGNLTYWLGNYGYKVIQSTVATLLKDLYIPLENNIARKEKWENTIQQGFKATQGEKVESLTISDLKPILDAPALLFPVLTNSALKSNPMVIDFLTSALAGMTPQKNDNEQDKWVNQLSKEKLVGWMIKGLQEILHTKDRHLKGLGTFLEKTLNNLTLALFSQASQLGTPLDNNANPNSKQTFFQAFINRLKTEIDELKSDNQRNEKLEKIIKNVMMELQLPSMLIDGLVPALMTKVNEYWKPFITYVDQLTLIHDMSTKASKRIKKYNNGAELEEVIDHVSDLILSQVAEKNVNMLENPEELLSQYFPGVKVTEKLQTWFKENVRGTNVLKEGIVAVLRQSIVNAIETNFNTNSEKYAEELIHQFQEVFSGAFQHFAAIKNQSMISKRKEEILKLEKILDQKPEDLSGQGGKLLQEMLLLNADRIKAQEYLEALPYENLEEKVFAEKNILAKAKVEEIDKNLETKTIAILQFKPFFGLKNWELIRKWGEEALEAQETIHRLQKEISKLEKELFFSKAAFEKALIIPRKIAEISNKIRGLKAFVAQKPEGILQGSTEETLLKEAVAAHFRYMEAERNLQKLQKSQEMELSEVTKQLSQLDSSVNWEIELQFPLKEEIQSKLEETSQKWALNLQKPLEEIKEAPESPLKKVLHLTHRELTIQQAEEELKRLKVDLSSKLTRIRKHRPSQKAVESWLLGKKWMRTALQSQKTIGALSDEVADLEHKLDEYLTSDRLNPFTILAEKLFEKLGLEKTINALPPLLKDKFGSHIATAKKQIIPRLLFSQMGPLINIPLKAEINKNKDELIRRSGGDPFICNIACAMCTQVVEKLPTMITSYRPIVERILELGNVPQNENFENKVQAMEKELDLTLRDLGSKEITPEMLLPLLQQIGKKSPTPGLCETLIKMLKESPSKQFSKDVLLELIRQVDWLSDIRLEKELQTIAQKLAKDLNRFVLSQGKAKLKAEHLFHAFHQVFKYSPNKNRKNEFIEISDEIRQVVLTPKELAEELNELVPGAKKIHALFASQFQAIIEGKGEILNKNKQFFEDMIEGALLHVLLKITEVNKPGKGSRILGKEGFLTALTENLINVLLEEKLDEEKSPEENAHALFDKILTKVFGICSPLDLEGIPYALQPLVYDKIRNEGYKFLQGSLLYFSKPKEKGLKFITITKEQVEDAKTKMVLFSRPNITKEHGSALNISAPVAKGYAEILSDHLADLVLSLPGELTGESGWKGMSVVVKIIQALKDNFNLMCKERGVVFFKQFIETSGLLNFIDGKEFKQILQNNIDKIAEKIRTEKENVRQPLSNAFVVLFNGLIKRAVKFEKDRQGTFARKLLKNFLKVGTGHLKNLKQAKENAADNERNLEHGDFVAVAGNHLHPGVLRGNEAPDFQKRQEKAYAPAMKKIIDTLFPHGKDDLTFISEELREGVWKIYEKNLFSKVLQITTEKILNPELINSLILKQLHGLLDTFGKDIPPNQPFFPDISSPDGLYLDELTEEEKKVLQSSGKAAGKFVREAIDMLQLPIPDSIKKSILDSETIMGFFGLDKESLGLKLFKAIDKTFIEDKLKEALKLAIKSVEGGEISKTLKDTVNDLRTPEEIRKNAPAAAAKMQAEIRKASRDVVSGSIAYGIRYVWVQAQDVFDKAVSDLLGPVGASLKQALDAVFRFVFFTIIGTILSVILWPLKQLAKEALFRILSLDENRDTLLGFFTRRPQDQPEGSHVIYNEDLIFKLVEALNDTILDTPIQKKSVEKENDETMMKPMN